MSGHKRRIFPRWNLHAAVDVRTDSTLYAGLSYDVSAGGLFVATEIAPPVGTNVAVTVSLPDGTTLDLGGTVRWVRDVRHESPGLPAGVGIEWDVLPMEALRLLLHFAELSEPVAWEHESELES